MKKFIDESWLVLAMGVVFACLLAGTQRVLHARIDENRVSELNAAIAEVVPGVADKQELTIDGNPAFRCVDAAGKLVGWAVKSTGVGFIDKITLVVGLSPDGGTITGIRVIEHVETPGLGSKINPGNDFPRQFGGKGTGEALEIVKHAPSRPNDIQAITGATYSSTYVTDIVNDVLTRIRPKLAEHR